MPSVQNIKRKTHNIKRHNARIAGHKQVGDGNLRYGYGPLTVPVAGGGDCEFGFEVTTEDRGVGEAAGGSDIAYAHVESLGEELAGHREAQF